MGDEVEVEAVQVLKKSLKLRTEHGQMFRGTLECFECADPYVIIVMVKTEHGHEARTDVHKGDLAVEMREWLEGKSIGQPMHIIPPRIEEAINKFIKYGKPPLQEDLLLWVASRCELRWSPETSLMFGGFPVQKVLHDDDDLGEYHEYIDPAKLADKTSQNPYEKTAGIASKKTSKGGGGSSGSGAFLEPKKTGILPTSEMDKKNGMTALDKMIERETGANENNITSAELAAQAAKFYAASDNTHELTRGLIGRSLALDELKTMKKSLLKDDHYKLSVDIEKQRKLVQAKMDERRRMIARSRAYQKHAADHYRGIRTELKEQNTGWFKQAEEELMALQKIEADIEKDVKCQKNKALRASQKVAWTIAPAGNQNRRGVSKPGAYLGPGPLPPDALFAQRDPKVEKTLKKYYWDSEGRKHVRVMDDEDHQDQDTASIIAHAMEEIRKASKTLGVHKLDLKRVFKTFDTSGDGFLTLPELAKALLSLGVKLTTEAVIAVYHHFDPNDSGSVHYGEFMWAFFNRRDLARKWKRETKTMTKMQIRHKFHSFDKDNSGRLTPKEFGKFLKSMNIAVTPTELDTMVFQFDKDGDGQLDMFEFQEFLAREMEELNTDATDGIAPRPPPSPKAMSRNASATSISGGNRPASANAGGRPGRLLMPGDNHHQRPSTSGGKDKPRPACECSMFHYHGECQHITKGWTKGDDEEKVDPHWATNSLKHQAEVESKVGRSYYKA
jgi:Ca2+-binding EF-hand superfamily protein